VGLVVVLGACQTQPQSPQGDPSPSSDLAYATTFSLAESDSGTALTIHTPWSGNSQGMHYFLHPKDQATPSLPDSVKAIAVPVERLVCYSTTHLPYLAMLHAEDALVAYPGTQYISTPSVKERVEHGQVRELGSDRSINPEVLLDTQPDVVMMFALDGPGAEYDQIQNSGTPVIFNADYLEEHALGRTEYIKLFGALLGKEEEATKIFAEIEMDFNTLLGSIHTIQKPTVFSGVVYGDTWFTPGADSWAADFITRAGGQYLYADHPGSGTLPLSFESVYAKCLDADYWIGVGSYTSKEELLAADARYEDFAAVQSGQVYSYMKRADPNGGVPYFELGYARPDLVLSDVIKILEPESQPDSLNFFIRLN